MKFHGREECTGYAAQLEMKRLRLLRTRIRIGPRLERSPNHV
jgi:hypothetical protein